MPERERARSIFAFPSLVLRFCTSQIIHWKIILRKMILNSKYQNQSRKTGNQARSFNHRPYQQGLKLLPVHTALLASSPMAFPNRQYAPNALGRSIHFARRCVACLASRALPQHGTCHGRKLRVGHDSTGYQPETHGNDLQPPYTRSSPL